MAPRNFLLMSVLFATFQVAFNQQNCIDYVKFRRPSWPCFADYNACQVDTSFPPEPPNFFLADACFVAIALENNDDNGFPGGINVNTDSSAPDATLPPGSPMDLTPSGPLLGGLTGREEPMFHLGRLPRNLVDIGANFVLFRGDRPEVGFAVNEATIATSRFVQMFIIAHDFNEDYTKNENIRLKDLLLRYARLQGNGQELYTAVVHVDWSRAAVANQGGTFYRQAAVNTVLIGRQLGVFFFTIVREGVVRPEDIHLIGIGLGAQVMHFAAHWFTELFRANPPGNPPANNDEFIKFGRLTALDPMATHFQGFIDGDGVVPHVNRLDATLVDVIHTSAVDAHGLDGDPLQGRVGMSQQLGRIDVYVNGGLRQPGCNTIYSLAGHGIYFPRSRCHHQKALAYFMTSLVYTNDLSLTAYPEPSWRAYLDLAADGDAFHKKYQDEAIPISYLGIRANYDDAAFGIFYTHLETRGDYAIQQMVGVVTEGDSLTKTLTRARERPQMSNTGEEITEFPRDQGDIVTAELSANDVPACGQFKQPGGSTGRINLGHRTYQGQFPWAVCIVIFYEEPQLWFATCTGSILSSEYVITAAHCFDDMLDKEGTPFYLSFGTTDCLRPISDAYIRRVHFSINQTVFSNRFGDHPLQAWDVSLIKLHDPISNLPREVYSGEPINTICWDSVDKFDYALGQKAYFAGFGTKSFELYEPSLTWMTTSPSGYPSRDSFILLPVYQAFITWPGNTYFWNTEPFLPRAPCQGDSGGPYMWYVKKAGDGQVGANATLSPFRAILVATEVAGPNCDFQERNKVTGRLLTPEIATKTGQVHVLQWIRTIVLARSPPGQAPLSSIESIVWPLPEFTLTG